MVRRTTSSAASKRQRHRAFAKTLCPLAHLCGDMCKGRCRDNPMNKIVARHKIVEPDSHTAMPQRQQSRPVTMRPCCCHLIMLREKNQSSVQYLMAMRCHDDEFAHIINCIEQFPSLSNLRILQSSIPSFVMRREHCIASLQRVLLSAH